jgi:Domain of unknown function (DUF4278)
MKLSFRGIKYEYKPVVTEVIEEDVRGIYRGVPSTIPQYHQLASRHKSSQERIYRGVHYRIL